MQSKRGSLIETCTGTAIGYSVAVLIQLIVFPLFDMHVTWTQNFYIAAIFTAVSLVRGYWVRRVFNWMHTKGMLR